METFESTCDKPYDRHLYQLVMKTGKVFMYEDYEMLRAAWFQLCGAGNLDRVVIIDAQQVPPEPKGFK